MERAEAGEPLEGSSRDITERTPLLRSKSRPRHHRRTLPGPGSGTASLTQAVLMVSRLSVTLG